MSNLESVFFFFNDTATTEIYTLSLHDALPISEAALQVHLEQEHVAFSNDVVAAFNAVMAGFARAGHRDRKSTRLNSSHGYISYAVFCLKKKNARERIKLSIERGYLGPTRNRPW